MADHSFTLDLNSVGENILIIGSSNEGEAKRLLDPVEVAALVQRSDRFQQTLNSFHGPDDTEFRNDLYEFGQFLFELVFARDLARLFASTQGSLGDGDALRFIIRIGSPNLSTILWEVMREEQTFLSHTYRFVRYPVIRKRRPKDLTLTRPAKMLVVAANPLGDLNIQRELDALDRALANLEDRVQVTKVIEPNATFDNIDAELKKSPDAFHFIGHATYNHDDPESSYMVIDGCESKESFGRLPLSSMSATLSLSPVNMLFLNACHTAAAQSTSITDNFVSLAYNLIVLGNRCVVAMSHAISDNAASSLTPAFYKGIFKDLDPVDLVLTKCKNDMYSGYAQGKTSPADWCSPVLYTRADKLNVLQP